eukprot:6491883-Amphidinium_carterae.2
MILALNSDPFDEVSKAGDADARSTEGATNRLLSGEYDIALAGWVVGRFTVVTCPLLLGTRVDPSGWLGPARSCYGAGITSLGQCTTCVPLL